MKSAMSTQPLPAARSRWPARLVLVAAASFAGTVWAFGILLAGRVPPRSPIEWFGTTGMPRAAAFNVLAFVIPGVLVGAVAVVIHLRAASAIARIGGWILLFSALAFALQGLFPLDPARPEASGRLHALCWSLWWLTTAAGASLAALRQRHRGGAGRAAIVAIALLVPAIAMFAPPFLGGAIAQRFAYGVWFVWWWLAARADRGRPSGSAASAPGSSRPASR